MGRVLGRDRAAGVGEAVQPALRAQLCISQRYDLSEHGNGSGDSSAVGAPSTPGCCPVQYCSEPSARPPALGAGSSLSFGTQEPGCRGCAGASPACTCEHWVAVFLWESPAPATPPVATPHPLPDNMLRHPAPSAVPLGPGGCVLISGTQMVSAWWVLWPRQPWLRPFRVPVSDMGSMDSLELLWPLGR